MDSQRIVLAHFALGGLSLLDSVDEIDNIPDVIDWIYSLQSPAGGFFGSDLQRQLSPDGSQVSTRMILAIYF